MKLLAALAAEAVLIGLAGRFGDFTVHGNVLRFVPLMLAAGACFLCAIRFFPADGKSAPLVFWSVAVLLRIVGLTMHPGDDLWRYVWEGRVQNAGFNPYVLGPLAPELAPLRDAAWAKINHPETAAIYPPLAELLFAGMTRVSSSPLLFKAVFAWADLLTVALLLALVGGDLRHRVAAWYAWNPAVVYAFAGAGHFDSLMICALTGAVLAHRRASVPGANSLPSAHGREQPVCMPTLLGASIAFKLVPLFLLPIFVRRWRALLVALAIPAALSIPYGGVTVLKSLRGFAEVTRFNDLVWWTVEAVTGPNPFGRNWPFTLAMLLALGVIAWRMRGDFPRALLWSLGAMLLLSPVLHPWYVTWILPFAVWRGQHAWTVLSLSALAALLLWETTPLWQAWQPNAVTRALVMAPPLGWLAAKRWRVLRVES